MSDPYARLSLNTMTTKSWTLREAVEATAAAGLPAIGLWRDRVAEAGVDDAAKIVRDHGLRVSSLCRGGFLTGLHDGDTALADNRRAIDEAATLGAPELIMVAGGVPDRDLPGARARLADRIAELVPYAAQRDVRLALEPLHPMFCADRAVISTLGQALELAAPHPAESVGVVVDTFHIWWDPELAQRVADAGAAGRISSYQICDWLVPMAADPLVSRGMMGDGVIDFGAITAMVAAAGYAGDVEVEIFNEAVWATEGHTVLETMKSRYRDMVLPAL
ncbi:MULTISPECIES: sugar phosphate isomerase/epimerase family protein [Mycobacteriaceae]|uniref:Xylose isomerase n=1 Tax=Mycolicibacterium neoaurum VKM Ac-1815D TaxID=700508 RepID=V5XCP3_MYCNE|nr:MULTISPECIES: sugar phosphate isomerase/epimerase family protein [Mycobacteriaceae]AHC25174.1 xylose isomerase [Mycolicibacterium neoaurum VKM Ac-1815D]AMO05672.1 xylose isomerase [Mycolicibacterium neoaurum]AXK76002.1 sugar phosphate isomerase/epimerase [Mycolicibacterium neoaurum]KJQ49478.1 xylose isomerase [Mycolicibacterium neoaurum]KUM09117.1 xylose isomerase [Mycolicibacterium neoaurum]